MTSKDEIKAQLKPRRKRFKPSNASTQTSKPAKSETNETKSKK